MRKTDVVTIMMAVCLPIIVGCSQYVQFGGKVVFDDDGSPLTTGLVVFTTDTFQAEGPLDKDGTYRLGSIVPKDGLPPGTYKVFISGAADYLDNGTVVPHIRADYLERTTTPLVCEVTRSGVKSFDISVPRPESGTKKN